jgi:1-acyl-sn-glycerol-3-phosphate acyltransferase
MMHLLKKRLQNAHNFLILLFGLLLLGAVMIAGSIGLLLYSLVLPSDQRKQNARNAITHTFRMYFSVLQSLNILHLDLSEIDVLLNDRGTILACNHPSLLDALLITSRLSNVVCIMKEQVLKNLLFGHGAKMAGYIPNKSIRDIVNIAGQELSIGSQLLLFPEGTRTRNATVNEFQGTVAVIAKRTGSDVQTILIESDSGFLGKGWPIYRVPEFPVHFRVRVGRRFSPTSNVKNLIAEMQEYFEQELSASRQPASTEPNCCASIEAQH